MSLHRHYRKSGKRTAEKNFRDEFFADGTMVRNYRTKYANKRTLLSS